MGHFGASDDVVREWMTLVVVQCRGIPVGHPEQLHAHLGPQRRRDAAVEAVQLLLRKALRVVYAPQLRYECQPLRRRCCCC